MYGSILCCLIRCFNVSVAATGDCQGITHPYLEDIALSEQLATECYHGGRNEQMWFGPSFTDQWADYDLASAYPTAMAMIGAPDWRAACVTTNLADFSSNSLGFALVKFKFPETVRYPTLPVRSQNGIIFPLEGKSYCCIIAM